MAVTNLLKQQVDQPVFEWMRFAPTATSATSALASSDDVARYLYYYIGQAMWRYDTYSDSWQECSALANPNTTVALRYSKYFGYRGHTIAATSTTITLAGFGKHTNIADGLKIRIVAGKGAGQERTITEVADAVVADFGVITSAQGGGQNIGDSTKKWRVNQWDGYQCRLVYGTGQSQIRRILYNDTTTIYFSDTNWQAIDSFNNSSFSSITPFAFPVTTAGSQAHYIIESSVATVDTPWDVTPDQSSVYQILGGGLWFFTSQSGSPYTNFYFYDILTDTWQAKTNIGGLITAAFGTDFSIERIGEVAGAFVSGLTATSGGDLSLINSGATMTYDRWANHQLRITAGKGVGQKRRIVGNTDTTFFVEHKWGITLDNTSQYAVYPDTDKLWVAGNGSSTLWQYSVERDLWANGHISDSGIARNISITPYAGATYEAPHEGVAASGIVYNANGVLTVAVGTTGGSNYVVGDLVTLGSTGVSAQAYVTGVTAGGVVTSLQLAASGTSYTSVTSSNTTGGSGTGLVIATTVGKVGNVTTATNHDFRHGEFVTIAGCATDTTFNGTFQVIGTASITTFSIANPSGTASPTAASSQSTSVLVDASQNWNTNEHTGKILYILSVGRDPTLTAARKIASNTATTITVLGSTITAATNGTSRYVIQEPRGFGAMCTNRIANKRGDGWATSGTATTLVDSSKDWNINQWVNCRVRVMCGTGAGNESVITANTATTLTVASWGVATPDATSKYEILDSFGVVTTAGTSVATVTDANKNFTTNILAGKRLRVVAGAAIGTELAITSNTATVITCASNLTTETGTLGNGTFYEIYEIPARSTGTDLRWLFNLSDTNNKGRWMISPRGGGSNIFDIYDIPTNTWEITPFISPYAITLTTGSMYAYDGDDSYFFTKDATGRIYELDLNTFKVESAGIIPYAHSTAIIGNRMEIVKTVDGLKYLYIMRHTGQEMWRTLKFW
jgi:hypothetical protein